MPVKNNSKNTNLTKELEKNVSSLLVMNNTDLKPYIELFEHHPENVYQQPLGSLVGFFEIKDYSEDSAYIVNFLMSVLKKEYYANPKRPVAESFDSALHKVNVALSELAKHKNVNWLGKLDAVVCVMEKSSVHFSVTGSGHIFIYRNNFLTDISDGLAPALSDPHPLKTFVDVSSGRIEEDDKLLLFSDDMFSVVPLPQLKKNLQRFSREDFVQFVKTALTNELEMTAALIIDVVAIRHPKPKNVSPAKNSAAQFNAFSQQTYSKQQPKLSDEFAAEISTPEPSEESSEKEYTDKKTGHIYVQGEGGQEESSSLGLFWEITKEHLAEATFHAKNLTKKRLTATKKGLAHALQSGKQALNESLEKAKEKSRQKAEMKAAEKEALAKQQAQLESLQKAKEEKLAAEQAKEQVRQATIAQKEKEEALRLAAAEAEREQAAIKPQSPQVVTAKEAVATAPKETEKVIVAAPSEPLPAPESLSLQQKIERMRQELEVEVQPEIVENSKDSTQAPQSDMDERIERIMGLKKRTTELPPKSAVLESEPAQIEHPELDEDESAVRLYIEKILAAAKKTLAGTAMLVKKYDFKQKTSAASLAFKKTAGVVAPHVSKISSLFQRLTKKQKYAALGIVLFIIVAPIALAKLTAPKKPEPVAVVQAPPSLSQILSQDKNISLSAQTNQVLGDTKLVSVLFADSVTYAIEAQKITTLSGTASKDYSLPDQAGQAITGAYMKDLNMLFILTDQHKVLSFSPVSKQFADNAITIPASADPKFIATYLTYLYMPDSAANQIYRYPRAAGGFGDKTDWYKDTLSLTGITDMTIDDSVYFVINNKIVKLFKGKNQTINFEDSKTPISFDKIYTTVDSQSLYVLDTKNARLVQYDKTGNIQNQYFNENLKGATTFTVDEQNKTAYIATPSGLLSLAL